MNPLFVSFALLAALQGQAERRVSGAVRAANDSTSIVSARVSVVGSPDNYLSGADGKFSLPRPGPGVLLVSVSALGFTPDTVMLGLEQDTVTVFLPRSAIQLLGLRVESEENVARARFDQMAQLSTVSLSAAELRRVPAVLEPDVLRAIQLLPGTVAKNDFSTGYNVRGGESDQNLVQMDGIPVFNPSHLGGAFSTFDPDAVAKTEFLTGGFPANYSGRLSSVLDIGIRSGDSTRIRGAAQVSLLTSKLLLEGPLPGPGTFLISARRTYLDAVVSTFTHDVLPYYFSDLLGKFTFPTRSAGTFAVTGYWGRDALKLNLVDSTETTAKVDLDWNWGNSLIGANWRLPVGRGQLETRAAFSEFTTSLGLLPDLIRYSNTAQLFTGGTTLSFHPGATHSVQVGVGAERYRMVYDGVSPALETLLIANRYRTSVLSAFVDEQWSASKRLLLRPGARLEVVPEAGFTGFSPRVAAKFFLGANTALTGSVGRYYQAIHSIMDQELPITIYEFWISADHYVPVGRSDHVVVGLEQWFARDFQITLEAYRKNFANLVSPNRGQSLNRQGDEFLPAQGNAWGVDLLLRRHTGAIRGWVAYSFTRAIRMSEGITYPPAHDRRHTLNIVVQTPGPFHSALAVRWGYGSPLPYTGFVGQWDHRRYNATDHVFDDANDEPIAGPRNGFRYPPYTRLDAGLRWSFRHWGATWEPFFQVVNGYNRRNVFLYFFNFADSPPTRTGVSQMPLLPTFGLEIRF